MRVEWKRFCPQEHATWRELFARRAPVITEQMHPMFLQGLDALRIGGDRIPDPAAVNQRLAELSGFRIVAVDGLEGPREFYAMLSEGEFPVGNFIRDSRDLSYTPAPDIFHDLYGHVPFLADRDYAEFCRGFGALAVSDSDAPERLREWERLFWFSAEFGLVKTAQGRRIFGAGLASSIGEAAYALGGEPEVRPFRSGDVRAQEFRIDEFQRVLFELESPAQLYQAIREAA